MIATVNDIWSLLTVTERRQSALLCLLMFAVGLAEISGLISVVPLVAVLTSANDPCARLSGAAGSVCVQLLPTREPYLLAGLAFGLVALSNMLAFIVTWLSGRLSWSVWRRLASTLFAAHMRLPYEAYFSIHTATAVKNVVFETERFANVVLMPSLVLLSRIVVTLAIIALLLFVDPLVSLTVITCLAGLYFSVYRQLRHRVSASGRVAFTERERISHIASETTAGLREVRMQGCEDYFTGRFDTAARSLSRQHVYGVVVGVLPRYIIETAAFAFMIGLAIYLSRRMGGWQTAAPLLAFYIFTAYRLLPQFQQIYANAMLVQHNASVLGGLRRPAPAAEQEQIGVAQASGTRQPRIRLSSVSYQYPGSSTAVLNNADMEIPPRATVGLVGATGAGKSTVIDLIAGLLQPVRGEVVIGETTLTPRIAAAWRTRIGYVPQTLFLLDDAIRRNIAFGLDDAAISQHDVERAARAANIHDFVVSLPEGYDTVVGERGVRLSGGQRQRLVIARALYRNPEVLIFDEATSALDQDTEQAVMEAIRSLSHRKTLLIISHRPATLAGCDLIYEVADGKIKRIGHESQA